MFTVCDTTRPVIGRPACQSKSLFRSSRRLLTQSTDCETRSPLPPHPSTIHQSHPGLTRASNGAPLSSYRPTPPACSLTSSPLSVVWRMIPARRYGNLMERVCCHGDVEVEVDQRTERPGLQMSECLSRDKHDIWSWPDNTLYVCVIGEWGEISKRGKEREGELDRGRERDERETKQEKERQGEKRRAN